MASQDISKSTNVVVLIVCLSAACISVVLRTGARWFKTRQIPLAAEDMFMYLALASFVTMCALYLDICGTFYNVQAVGAGIMPPYATLMADLSSMLKEFFGVQFFFWSTLWCVKCSLLFMFRKLTTGLPVYTKIWWAVVLFTGLTFIGCAISQFTSCAGMHEWLSPLGLCNTPRDAVAKAASLWYSLAVDLLTDLMIMAIPVRILYSLQISTAQKISVGFMFVVGIITMIFAIVRVVSLDSGTKDGQVSTTWLILWAAIEGAVAIIVGCLPPFAIFVRGRVAASRVQYYGEPGQTPQQNSGVNAGPHSSRAKCHARNQSLALSELEPNRHSVDGGSGKSLVDGSTSDVSEQWKQKWHSGATVDR